jgi:hypothetical protein
MNRNKLNNIRSSPIEMKKNADHLSPQKYEVEKIDERNFLSTVKRPAAHKIYQKNDTKYGNKVVRFTEIHSKRKAWVPAPNQYDYPTDKIRKYTSRGPSVPAYKR